MDNTLTYYENMEHLRSIAQMLTRSLDTFEIERMAELQKQYMKEHFVSYYLACQMAGETTSTAIASPLEEHQFSLREYIKEAS